MQEKTTFQLSEQFLAGSADTHNLKKELLRNIQAIEALLVGYHFSSRGRVFNVLLDEDSLSEENSFQGQFKVNYFIGQFNACADLDFTEKAFMQISFNVDIANNIVTLTGEYIPEREPDEC